MNDMQMLANIAGMTAELIERGELVRVVRCRDCKHRTNEMYDYYGNPNNKVYVCQINDLAKKPDWFCADGKRRENDKTDQ